VRDDDLRRAIRLSLLNIAWSAAIGGIAVSVALGSGALSLLGFGVNSLIDATASAAIAWRFTVEGRRPALAERVERLAERIVGAALVALALYLVYGSLRAFATGDHPRPELVGVVLLVVSLAVQPMLAIAKYRVAMRLGSGAFRADALLTGIGGALAAISLAGIALATIAGIYWGDAAAATIVALVALREGLVSLDLGRRRPTGG
jgi:divalent metal cation (Fe/Co/Zn/Cd) transporter